jgi:hypothetical protein
MNVWLLWEDYLGENILIGVFSSKEQVDRAIEKWFKKYGTDVGNIWWEEIEVDKLWW